MSLGHVCKQWKKRDECSVGREKLSSGALRDEARGFSTIEAAAVLSQRKNTRRSHILRLFGGWGLGQPSLGSFETWDGRAPENKTSRCEVRGIPQRGLLRSWSLLLLHSSEHSFRSDRSVYC